MSSLGLIVIGILAVWAGVSGTGSELIEAVKNPAPGYAKLDLSDYVLGGMVASLPLFALKGREDWANGYILLIVMGVMLYNYNSLNKFANFIQRSL